MKLKAIALKLALAARNAVYGLAVIWITWHLLLARIGD